MKVQNILVGLILVVLLAVTAGAQTAPPVLNPIGAQVVNEGQTLQFRVSSSDLDLTTPILSTSTLPPNAVFVDSLNGAGSFTFSPDFTQAGPITVTFYAADAVTTADTASEIVTITVNNVNRKPALVVPGAQNVNEGQTLNFGVTATDPDGGTPTLNAISVPTNATFTDNANGTGTLAFSPDFTQAGPYSVIFIASDGTLADTQAVAITVNNVNRKPALVVPGAQAVNEGQTLNFGVTATDPDGGTPTLSAINVPTNATFTDHANGSGTLAFSPDFTQAGPYTVSFIATDGTLADTQAVAITVDNVNRKPTVTPIGSQLVAENQTLNLHVQSSDPDGTIPVLTALSLPANATFADSANGAGGFTFVPATGQAGGYSVSFVASDGALADTIAVAITVTHTNIKPTLTVPGAQVMDEGQTLNFGVSAVDPEGTTPVLSAINVPANATFTDHANGSGTLAFSPDFAQAGPYTVSFIASDGSLADTQTVAISVNNVDRKPVITPIGAQSIAENQILNLHILSSDPDGTTPILTALNVPVNATFADSANGAGGFTFTPNNTQTGVHNVSFIASDGTLADTIIVQITVTHTNVKPTLTVPGAQAVNEGQVLAFRVSAVDPEGTTPVLTAINLPTHATFADSANGAGALTFSPDFTQAGPYTVTFIASDGSLADTQTVAITVSNVNRKPALTVPSAQTVTEGQVLAFRVSAVDPDGGTPTLTTGTLPTHATFADSTNGAGGLTFSPDFTQSGSYAVQFIASDGTLADTQSVSITVLNFGVNVAPTIAPIADTSVNEGDSIILTITTADPDGAVAPELSINSTLKNYSFLDHRNFTGTLTYRPSFINAGVDTVRVFATDFGSPRLTATATFVITTKDVNQAPKWTQSGPFSLSAGQTLSIVTVCKDSTDPVSADRLFLSVLDLPTNATFKDSANGHGLYTFAPTVSQVGVDTVHFLAVDQGAPALSSIMSVIITVRQANRPPVLASIGPKMITEGQLLRFRISAADPEGVIPTLTADNKPLGATLVDSGNGAGSFSWTPSFMQSGLYAVTFKASDGINIAKEVVLIQVSDAGNQRPVFDSLPAISVVEADSVTQNFTASDPDGGTITISAVSATVPAFVTFSFSAGIATIKAKPGFGSDGVYNIQLVASDGTLADTATVVLTVINAGNQPPILAAIGAKQVTELLTLQFRVSATDADGSKPKLTASPLPTGAVFSDSLNGAGSFVWTPTETDSGHYLVTFFAQDADSLPVFDSEQVIITVKDTNRLPLIITSGSRSIFEGDTLRYPVYATDPDGTIPHIRARLDGTADTLATNMSMYDSANGSAILTFTPSYSQGGTSSVFYYVRFYAKDAADSSLIKDASAPVQIQVTNKVRPPQMVFSSGTGPLSVVEGGTLTFTVTASDLDGGSITGLAAAPLPTNATFSGTLPVRTFTFTPSFLQAGTYSVTFTATKTGGTTATQVVTINVTDAGNQSPIFSTVLVDTTNCPVNIITNLLVHATDPELNAITLTASPLGGNIQFRDSTNGTGLYSYSPDATELGTIFRVTIIATDPLAAADTVTTVMRVTAFLRGDVDNNAKYTMNDLAYLIGYLYRQGPKPPNLDAADVDKDGGVNIGDITYLINFLYLNGTRPPQ